MKVCALFAFFPMAIQASDAAVSDQHARAKTYGYLVNLRAQVETLIASGGDWTQAADVDQSRFSTLEQFERLSRKNAEVAFTQVEFA